MGKFEVILPLEIIEEIEKIEKNVTNIFGEMTKAGAELVRKKIESYLPKNISASNMRNNLFVSRTYRTPTDGAINNKVGFAGYFINKKGKKTPAPLVATLIEYGGVNNQYPKHPFFRKSFVKKEIEQEMFRKQVRLSGGLLDE